MDVLAHATDGADGDDPFDAEGFHAVEVGAKVDCRWRDAVAAPVTRQENHFTVSQGAQNEGVGRWPEGGFDLLLANVFQSRHGVQAAAANHSDPALTHTLHSPLIRLPLLQPGGLVSTGQLFGNLHRVQRSTSAQVVGDYPHVQAVGHSQIGTDAPNEHLVPAVGLNR